MLRSYPPRSTALSQEPIAGSSTSALDKSVLLYRYHMQLHCISMLLQFTQVIFVSSRSSSDLNVSLGSLDALSDAPGAQRGRLDVAAAETWKGARGAGPARALLTTFLPVKNAGAALRAVKVAAIAGNCCSLIMKRNREEMLWCPPYFLCLSALAAPQPITTLPATDLLIQIFVVPLLGRGVDLVRIFLNMHS